MSATKKDQKETKSPFNRFAIETDLSVFVQQYVGTGDVRIRFDEGGFIKPWHLFKVRGAVLSRFRRTGRKDDFSFRDGRVAITGRIDRNDRVEMDVEVLPPGRAEPVRKTLLGHVVEEIKDRLAIADTVILTYSEGDDADGRPAKAAGKNGAAQPVAGELIAATAAR
jgi:hypothetical protein